ncbi:MAG: hypothetical protein RLZZ306_2893 [Bacteroidota bacterium]
MERKSNDKKDVENYTTDISRYTLIKFNKKSVCIYQICGLTFSRNLTPKADNAPNESARQRKSLWKSQTI